MIWLKIISLVLQLSLAVISYLERQKAIKEGEANALRILLEKADAILSAGRIAADNVSHDPDAILGDEYNRKEDRVGDKENNMRVVLPDTVPVSGGHRKDTPPSSS